VLVPLAVKVALKVENDDDEATTLPVMAALVEQSVTIKGRLFLNKKRVINVVVIETVLVSRLARYPEEEVSNW
jgi:hypothetical protein